MTVQVLYFAGLREALGSGERIELPAGVATVGALKDWLVGQGRERLATARNALEAVCSDWAETGRLDEALVQTCRAALAEIGRVDAELEVEAPAVAGTPREGTKQARLIEMLRRPEGVTIAEIDEATGWQPHTVRGAIAGALKKKLGPTVTSEKPDQGERIYRLG